MPRMTAIEYAQAVRWLTKLVQVVPLAPNAMGDIQCIYCQAYQSIPQRPVHETGCVWDAAREFLVTYGVIDK